MKARYWAHHPMSKDEKIEIWKNAIFVFDTSTMLDLYRFSQATRDEVFEILEGLGERSWLTAQVAKEIYHGRLGAIRDQVNSYDQVLQSVNEKLKKSVLKPLESKRHPYVTDATLAKLREVLGEIRADAVESRKTLEDLATDDNILPRLSELIGDRVGAEYSEDQLKKHAETFEKRLKDKVPPGFADGQKDASRAIGDYLVWRQSMDLCSEQKKPLVFVTSDAKEDWWLLYGKGDSERVVGPRPELLMEFLKETGCKVLLLDLDEFLPLYAEIEGKPVSEGTQQEAAAVSRAGRRESSANKLNGRDVANDFKEFYSKLKKSSVNTPLKSIGEQYFEFFPAESLDAGSHPELISGYREIDQRFSRLDQDEQERFKEYLHDFFSGDEVQGGPNLKQVADLAGKFHNHDLDDE